MKFPRIKIYILITLTIIAYEKILFSQSNRNLQESEEEEYYDDEYVPIETYQRRSIRIGTERGSVYKIFKYFISPIKGQKTNLTIDFYSRVEDDVTLYIYTDEEDIYYDPKNKVFKDSIYEEQCYNQDQIIITEGDFLSEEGYIYLVFSAPEVGDFNTYITLSLENELYEVFYIFRYTYYNNEAKTYYFHINSHDENVNLYLQFQSLISDPDCNIKITTDDEFQNIKFSEHLTQLQYGKFISLEKGQDYYIELTLDRQRHYSHGYHFDIAFSFNKYDDPIIIDFEEGFSEEAPIIISQDLFFFMDVSELEYDNVLIRGNYVYNKIESYSYCFYDKSSPHSAVLDFKKNDFKKLKESDFTSVASDVYLKIPRNNNDKDKKILGFKVKFNATAINMYDNIEGFYMIKLLKDPLSWSNFNFENENILYLTQSDFEKNNVNVLIASTSNLNGIVILDFSKEDSDAEYLDYIPIYKNQFYIFDKKILPDELILIINEEESYCEFKHRFFNDIEILSNLFDSYGRLFTINDCGKTYLMFSQENENPSEEEKSYIYYRQVYGDAQVFFGRMYEYNNEIESLLNPKYFYESLSLFDADEEFYLKIICSKPSNIHLIYFDSTNTFTADTGNFYPIYLDSKAKPYDERALDMINRKFDFELELIKDKTQHIQSFNFEFQERNVEMNLKNPKVHFSVTMVENELLEFSEIKGKNLVFFKIDLEEEEYVRYEESIKITDVPTNKVLIFPFEERLMVQTFILKNPFDRMCLICIYNDYSSVYIHPIRGSCFYLNERETKTLNFQFGNLFRFWSSIGNEEFYTVLYVDDNIEIDYKIEEGEDPGYDDSDEFDEEENEPEEINDIINPTTLNILIFIFLFLISLGIIIILRITKFNDGLSEMKSYQLDIDN